MASWVIGFISATGYWGILLLMFVENIFPPIPSEVIMPLAGYMVAHGSLTFLGATAAGMGGSVLGALPLYFAGRKLDKGRVKRYADRHGRWLTVSGDDIDRASRWFDRHGGAAVLLCRLIPGVRSLISIPAGISGMNLLSLVGGATGLYRLPAWQQLLEARRIPRSGFLGRVRRNRRFLYRAGRKAQGSENLIAGNPATISA